VSRDLVHFNLAIGKHPLDHPSMAGFTSQLAEVNRLAETSPGFLWTPVDDEAGDAVATFGHPLVLANMSTWRSLEDLRRFVYEGLHGGALKHRREWFEPIAGPAYVLWWGPAGYRPTWIEAKQRLQELELHGPTPNAFTFAHPFSPSGESVPVAE
jgi:hypothetical protein